MPNNKAMNRKRRVLGVCTRCGWKPPKHGRAQCSDCLEHEAYRDKARSEEIRIRGAFRYEKRQKGGLCVRCGKSPERDRVQCTRCLERLAHQNHRHDWRKKLRDTRARHIEQGITCSPEVAESLNKFIFGGNDGSLPE
jgi:hypothetical protein